MHVLVFLFTFITLLFSSCSSSSSKNSAKIVRIPTPEEPTSLDPRTARDLPSVTVMRLLYEGLYRINNKGGLEPAIAQSVEISDDLKTYTFTLRKSFWSDGTALTAYDFEKSWKSVLSPDFPAPNAYQLYILKEAKNAKLGLTSMDNVGVKATSENTLVIDLENPAPYFLELTSCHFYFPVAPAVLARNADWQSRDKLVSNGPFELAHWKARDEIQVVKNPHYYDREKIKIDGVALQVIDEHTALQLFKAKQIDWAGSPLSTLPQDAIQNLKQKGVLQIAFGAGTHWCCFNTVEEPFNHVDIRRALNLALDRQAIVEHVTQGNQPPALGILPFSLTHHKVTYFVDNNIKDAQRLFEKGLSEAGLNKNLLHIVLSYAANDRNLKVAQTIQQQWNKALGIDVQLEAVEGKVLISKLSEGDYQIALGSWYADIQDPINFLEIFKYSKNPTNKTKWQDNDYIALLDASEGERKADNRFEMLLKAEAMLMDQMPVAPLFHSAYNFLRNPEIEGIYFSPLGYLDFKEAYYVIKNEEDK